MATMEGDGHIVAVFTLERETKNTFRFIEQENNLPLASLLAVGTLYVNKAALEAADLGEPRTLTVTIEAS